MTKSKIEIEMEERANEQYQQVAPDLPPQGQFHWSSAIGYLADWLYDHYRSEWKKGKFARIAKRVVNRYCSCDNRESQQRAQRIENAWKRKQKAGRIGLSLKLKRPATVKSWDEKKPTRLGTGSY